VSRRIPSAGERVGGEEKIRPGGGMNQEDGGIVGGE